MALKLNNSLSSKKQAAITKRPITRRKCQQQPKENTKKSQVLIPQIIYPRIKRQSKVDWPLTFDETLAEIMGMIIHNGKILRDESAIQIRNTSKFFEFEDRLTTLLKTIEIELNVKSRYWPGMYQQQAPRISSAEFTHTFLDMLECSRLDQLLGVEKVPMIVKQSPLPIQKAFLDGYLSTCATKFVVHEEKYYVQVIPYMPSYVDELVKMLNLQKVECITMENYFLTDFGVTIEAGYAES